MRVVVIRTSCGGFRIGYGSWMGYFYPCGTHKKLGWCGQCYENLRGRANHKNHARYSSKREPWTMPLKKPSVASASTPGLPPSSWQDSCLKEFSTLMEFLSSASYEDGSKRVPGTLQLAVSAGRWQVKLRDLENKTYCFVTGELLTDCLLAAETLLEEGNGDWRKDDWSGKRPSGK